MSESEFEIELESEESGFGFGFARVPGIMNRRDRASSCLSSITFRWPYGIADTLSGGRYTSSIAALVPGRGRGSERVNGEILDRPDVGVGGG